MVHPLMEELSSLRGRWLGSRREGILAHVMERQNEAHASALKLLHHALDTSALSERLSALAASFAASSTALEQRVFALESELQAAEAKLTAEQALNGELGAALAGAKLEGERARVEDRSAAGMMERYICVSCFSLGEGLVSSFSLPHLHSSMPASLPASLLPLSSVRRVRMPSS
ncbi:hypothetical protein FB451DRAFT_1568409 [Mycena latifolia]|nr:hypothetical protein FB451DRAFT_1568409 [Mycena latifolia]